MFGSKSLITGLVIWFLALAAYSSEMIELSAFGTCFPLRWTTTLVWVYPTTQAAFGASGVRWLRIWLSLGNLFFGSFAVHGIQ